MHFCIHCGPFSTAVLQQHKPYLYPVCSTHAGPYQGLPIMLRIRPTAHPGPQTLHELALAHPALATAAAFSPSQDQIIPASDASHSSSFGGSHLKSLLSWIFLVWAFTRLGLL